MTYSHFVVTYQTVWNACILLITQKVKSSMLYERRQTQHESFFRMLVSICKISSNFSRVCIFTFLLWIKKRWEWKMFMQFVFLGVICKLFIFLKKAEYIFFIGGLLNLKFIFVGNITEVYKYDSINSIFNMRLFTSKMKVY